MTDDPENGIVIGRTKKNKIRLTAQKDDQTVQFVFKPGTAQVLVSELQREIHKAGGEHDYR